MALGTPIVAGTAYSAVAGTTVSPAYPAGVLATDVVVLFVGQKPFSSGAGSITTPTGWTLRDQLDNAGGYSGGAGIDTGATSLRVYTWDNPVAGQTGTQAVTLGGNDVTWAFMVRIPSGGETHSFGSADGQRTTAPTAGTPFTVALTNGTSATNFQAGDIALWAMCIPTDVTTPNQFSAQSVTATGATFATAVELNEPDSNVSNDIGGYSAYASVSSGSSTAAPSVTVTAAGTVTNVRGPVVMLRIRDLSQALTQTSRYDNTNAFHNPTITQTTAAQDLSPARYDNTSTFFTPDVTQSGGAQNLAPALYANTNTFYSANAAANNILTATRYNNTNVFYAATVSALKTLTPDRYNNSNSFYTANLEQSAQSQALAPSFLINANAFYAHSVSTNNIIALSIYENSNTFYAANVATSYNISPTIYNNANVFYSASVVQPGGTQALTASLFTNTNTFFPASIGATPIQPILGGGSLVRPRKKFRPAILFDFPEPEIVLPDASAKAVIGNFSVTVELGSVIATSPDPINSRTSLTFTQIETYMLGVRAESSWNDPSDDELLFILDFALD